MSSTVKAVAQEAWLHEATVKEIFKRGAQRTTYEQFDRTMVASESHRGWAAKLIIADEIRSIFTPLTLLHWDGSRWMRGYLPDRRRWGSMDNGKWCGDR